MQRDLPTIMLKKKFIWEEIWVWIKFIWWFFQYYMYSLYHCMVVSHHPHKDSSSHESTVLGALREQSRNRWVGYDHWPHTGEWSPAAILPSRVLYPVLGRSGQCCCRHLHAHNTHQLFFFFSEILCAHSTLLIELTFVWDHMHALVN